MKHGKKILELRKANGMTQSSLAESAGISIRTLQRIEKDETSPHDYTLDQLANALGVSRKEFLEKKEWFKVNMMIICCIFSFIPILFNLLIPLFIYSKIKAEEEEKALGGIILTLQIFWTVFTIMLLFITPTIAKLIFGSANPGNFQPINFVLVLLQFINALMMIGIGLIKSGKKSRLLLKLPNLFKVSAK